MVSNFQLLPCSENYYRVSIAGLLIRLLKMVINLFDFVKQIPLKIINTVKTKHGF